MRMILAAAVGIASCFSALPAAAVEGHYTERVTFDSKTLTPEEKTLAQMYMELGAYRGRSLALKAWRDRFGSSLETRWLYMGDRARWFVDLKTVRVALGSVELWVRLPSPEGDAVTSALLRLNCRDDTWQILRSAVRTGRGDVMSSNDVPDAALTVAPDTVSEQTVMWGCG
jgi:hypothetical protein